MMCLPLVTPRKQQAAARAGVRTRERCGHRSRRRVRRGCGQVGRSVRSPPVTTELTDACTSVHASAGWTLEPGETLVEQGEPGEDLHLVLDGVLVASCLVDRQELEDIGATRRE